MRFTKTISLSSLGEEYKEIELQFRKPSFAQAMKLSKVEENPEIVVDILCDLYIESNLVKLEELKQDFMTYDVIILTLHKLIGEQDFLVGTKGDK